MIFHHPLPLNPNAKSASGIRPLKMLKAFKELGYDVYLVTGYVAERRIAIQKLKASIQKGEKYEFCYSESSTMPTALTEKHHLPIAPFLDFNFFHFLKKQNISIGLFYRDIYWLFPEYYENLSFIKGKISNLFYRYDLKAYSKTLTKLYLPSLAMAKYIPTPRESFFESLPPGFTPSENNQKHIPQKNDQLHLLYIGGLSGHYQMHKIIPVLQKFNGKIQFTLCTRESEWNTIKNEYLKNSNEWPSGFNIVHKSGDELLDLYKNTDITMLFVKPQEYWNFAAPVKLYEYLGQYKPIITTIGTLAGEFVEQNGIGWNIRYDEDALISLLNDLLNNPQLIQQKTKNMQTISLQHTWTARATKVASDLTKV